MSIEAAHEAYVDGRIAVAAKLITGASMEPHEEAQFVVELILAAFVGDRVLYEGVQLQSSSTVDGEWYGTVRQVYPEVSE